MKEIQILNNGDALYDIRRKINENFELVHNEATTEPLVSFGVNEGNETNGVADLLDIDGDTLNFKVGGEYPNLVMTSGDGVTTKIESVNPLHLQNLADGEYKVVVDGSNSNITDAEFYSQLLEPENPNDGDVWFNGENAFSYNNTGYTGRILSNGSDTFNCMANAGNLYVAAGKGKAVLASNNAGQSWQLINLQTDNDNIEIVGAVEYNNKVYLVASDKSSYYVDQNLTTWNSSLVSTANVTPNNLRKVGEYFVITTNSGALIYSTDMTTYQSTTLAPAGIYDIAYTGGRYFVLGSGQIYTSTNLTSWGGLVSVQNMNCLLTYDDDTVLVGGNGGAIQKVTSTTNKMTLISNSLGKNIKKMSMLSDGNVLIVGDDGLCVITKDLSNFENIYESNLNLKNIHENYIVGQSSTIIKLNAIGSWVPYPYIPVGEVIISGGEVTYFTTYPYNTNGLFEATSSTFGLLRTAAEPDELNCHCQEAVLTPANLYNLNNYRTMNTSYEVDQKVGCPYHHNLQLNCIQAGTTSNEGLNTKGLLEPGTTIEDGTVIWEVQELGTAGGGLPMFAHIWSDHIYKDASYLRADTYSWHDGRIYKTGYEILEEQYDNEESVIEVEEGITYKRTPDGFKIADETQQDAIRSLYETKGIAWIYVIDKANKRFKLPRTKWGFVGIRDGVGNTVEAGLPNIEGMVKGFAVRTTQGDSSGSLTLERPSSGWALDVGSEMDSGTVTFDASKSSTIYGNSDTVQQPGTQMYLYFYIGAYKRPETEIEVGKLTEIINAFNNPFSLLDYKYSEYELNNISWLRSEGQYNSKAVFVDTYNLLLAIYNGTHIKTGVTVKLNTEDFTDYDFVLNTAEETFRLPIKVKLASGKAVKGNGMGLGLTNGTRNGGIYEENFTIKISTDTFNTAIGSSVPSGQVGMDGKVLGVTTDPTKSGLELSDSGLYLYFYVGETVQNANLINAGRIEEKLGDKLDRSAVKAYIVGTYVNGTSGYRVWSDKYCEQWGLSSYPATVTLLKNYKDTNWNIVATIATNSTKAQYENITCIDKTVSSFYLDQAGRGVSNSAYWRACGYIA